MTYKFNETFTDLLYFPLRNLSIVYRYIVYRYSIQEII